MSLYPEGLIFGIKVILRNELVFIRMIFMLIYSGAEIGFCTPSFYKYPRKLELQHRVLKPACLERERDREREREIEKERERERERERAKS